MLLQFSAENFCSIAQRVELSMRAAVAPHAAKESALIHLSPDLQLLRCAAIYGANTSGKSNLVTAMLQARELIVAPPASRDSR